jgi:hypothetical protein
LEIEKIEGEESLRGAKEKLVAMLVRSLQFTSSIDLDVTGEQRP